VYVYNKAYVKELSLDIFALSSFRLSRNNTKYIPQRDWGFLNQWWRKKQQKTAAGCSCGYVTRILLITQTDLVALSYIDTPYRIISQGQEKTLVSEIERK